MKYLAVVAFAQQQHYRDRKPVWIKLYLELVLTDPRFLLLPDAARSHLLGLFALAPEHNNRIPHDRKYIAARLCARSKVDLALLVRSGFLIEVDSTIEAEAAANPEHPASKPLADPEQDASPKRREGRGTDRAVTQGSVELSPRVREERDRLLARLPEAFAPDVDVWLARLADDTRRFSSLRRMLATLWPEGGEAKWPKGEHVGLALQGYNAENGDRWPFFESILRGVREQAKYGVATPRPPAPSGTGPSRFTPPEDPDAPLDAPSSANVARRRDADPEWWERMQAEAAAAGRSNPWRYAYKAMQAEAYARPIPTP